MSLEQIYTRFLASPRVEALDPSASFHYITTAVSVNGPEKIISQLNRENLKQFKKRVEKVLASVSTGNSLVLEIETEIEFLTSGANWLPGLDDNFLADHVVRFPVVHIVNFNGNLIKEARLYWDQANILKQLNVIGRSGRNWPIRDGPEQIKMITDSISRHSVSTQNGSHATGASTPERSRSKGPANATRDPHASLHLFSPADQDVEVEKVRAPRSNSAFRPPSRDPQDIIGESYEPPQPVRPPRSNSTFRPPSRDLQAIIGESNEPPKPVNPPKSRGSFSHGQTFDLGDQLRDDSDTPRANAQRTPNFNAKKYEHFEFDDGDGDVKPVATRPLPGSRGKNMSSWDFEDFVTPEKRPLRVRKDDIRQIDWSEDDEEKQPPKPLSNITNALNNARRNDTSQFEIADNSPADGASELQKKHDRPGKSDRNRSGYQWTAHQNALDDDNAFFGGFGKETKSTGIHIAGDGRGQNKSLGKNWSWDQDSPSAGTQKDYVPGKTQGFRK